MRWVYAHAEPAAALFHFNMAFQMHFNGCSGELVICAVSLISPHCYKPTLKISFRVTAEGARHKISPPPLPMVRDYISGWLALFSFRLSSSLRLCSMVLLRWCGSWRYIYGVTSRRINRPHIGCWRAFETVWDDATVAFIRLAEDAQQHPPRCGIPLPHRRRRSRVVGEYHISMPPLASYCLTSLFSGRRHLSDIILILPGYYFTIYPLYYFDIAVPRLVSAFLSSFHARWAYQIITETSRRFASSPLYLPAHARDIYFRHAIVLCFFQVGARGQHRLSRPLQYTPPPLHLSASRPDTRLYDTAGDLFDTEARRFYRLILQARYKLSVRIWPGRRCAPASSVTPSITIGQYTVFISLAHNISRAFGWRGFVTRCHLHITIAVLLYLIEKYNKSLIPYDIAKRISPDLHFLSTKL